MKSLQDKKAKGVLKGFRELKDKRAILANPVRKDHKGIRDHLVARENLGRLALPETELIQSRLSNMSDLETRFTKLMHSIYVRAKDEAGYTATIFLRMLGERGAIATAKYLLNEPKVSTGFVTLFERGRLDLTVEAQLLTHPEFHELFTEAELHQARAWLRDYGYSVSG